MPTWKQKAEYSQTSQHSRLATFKEVRKGKSSPTYLKLRPQRQDGQQVPRPGGAVTAVLPGHLHRGHRPERALDLSAQLATHGRQPELALGAHQVMELAHGCRERNDQSLVEADQDHKYTEFLLKLTWQPFCGGGLVVQQLHVGDVVAVPLAAVQHPEAARPQRAQDGGAVTHADKVADLQQRAILGVPASRVHSSLWTRPSTRAERTTNNLLIELNPIKWSDILKRNRIFTMLNEKKI